MGIGVWGEERNGQEGKAPEKGEFERGLGSQEDKPRRRPERTTKESRTREGFCFTIRAARVGIHPTPLLYYMVRYFGS